MNTHSTKSLWRRALAAVALFGLASTGCERDAVWSRELGAGESVALERSVVWPVAGRRELAFFSPTANVVRTETMGDVPQTLAVTGAGRTLVALDAAGGVAVVTFDDVGRFVGRVDYALGSPFEALELSSDGAFAVFHHGGASPGTATGAVVRNPNEVAILDLTRPAAEDNPVRRTLRSFGAGLRRLVLSGPGEIGGTGRRLAWALSDRYLALFDLAHPNADEIVVRFTLAQDTREVVPTSVVPVPAEGDAPPGALVTASGTQDVYLLSFSEATPPDEVPRPVLNALPGGGGSESLALRVAGGLRVFTAVGNVLSIVDPQTGGRKALTLPIRVEHIRPFVGADGAQQALLWADGGNAVVFARLDDIEAARGRALSVLTMEASISRLLPVPGVAEAVAISNSRLVLLDFRAQTATPFDIGGTFGTPSGDAWYTGASELGADAIQIAPDGSRLFALVQAASPTALSIDLATGTASSVELADGGVLRLLPGVRRLVVDHGDMLGAVTALPMDDLTGVEPETFDGLFLTEVLDR